MENQHGTRGTAEGDDEHQAVEVQEPLDHETDESPVKPLTNLDPAHKDGRTYLFNAFSYLME